MRGLRRQGRAALIPFVTAGHPTRDAIVPLLRTLEEAGAAAVELGIPFSDPLADGPVIQTTSRIALENGVTIEQVLGAVADFHRQSDLPIVLMSYVNPVLAYGAERFAARAQEAGVSGVILTDLPPEERADVWQCLARRDIDAVLLVAPTTDMHRRQELARRSRGFVYCVSRTGVTGDQSAFAGELETVISVIRRSTDLPVGVGFGVDGEQRARQVAGFADAVIVGAAPCRRLEEHRGTGLESALGVAESFVRQLAQAIAEIHKNPANGTPAL